jgi:hypothetical protein
MFRFSSRTSSDVDPLVSRVGAFAVFHETPVAVMVADAEGTIVQRNRAAVALAAKVLAERGGAVLAGLRDELADVIRHERSYPTTRVVQVNQEGRHAQVEVFIGRLDEGYVVVWTDVTAASEASRATRSVADELAASSASLTVLSDQIAAGASDVSARAASVAAGSEQMSASIREIAVSAAAAANGTSSAVGAAGTANERLAKLSESSTRIGAVSKLITAIAEQTNLLALNATIEAARAGEAGKGFAVVAGEVKELAGRTRSATAEITEMIAAIQADSADAANAIGDILRLIDEVESQQSTVASAVEEQTAVANEMSTSVAGVADAAAVSANAVEELRRSADFVAVRAKKLDALFTS